MLTAEMPSSAPVWLASRSPRRRQMLAQAGASVCVRPAEIDDGSLTPGCVRPIHWAMALAYLKARCVADSLRLEQGAAASGTVLAADTICVHRGCILGQPADADEARAMLIRMRGDTHETITGVCVLSLSDRRRWILADRAFVHYGPVSDAAIDSYLESGQWRGKAGAYNLRERVEAGWPVWCDGDPATVMGLPLKRLEPWLARLRKAAP